MIPWWLLLIFMKYSTKVSPDEYNYVNPNMWKDDFPMCGGPMQSPISLTATRLALSRTPKLQFAKGLEHAEVEAYNTGREVKLTLRPANRTEPFLRVSSFSKPLLGTYKFVQFHFHWGEYHSPNGSEHAVAGEFTDAEAHFVFYNERYGSFLEASRNFDGLMVIGILLKGTEIKKPVMFPTLGMESRMWELSRPGKKFRFAADLTPLQSLLKKAVGKFYSYHGSLTTPPCNPVVTWVVSAMDTGIDDAFLSKLSTTIYRDDDARELLVNNYRPVQNQRGRVVTKHITIA